MTKQKHFSMLLRSWSEAENTFLFVLNPTREKESQNNSKADFTKATWHLSAHNRAHAHVISAAQGETPPQRGWSGGLAGKLWLLPQSHTEPTPEGPLPPPSKLRLSTSPEGSLIVPPSPKCPCPWSNGKPTFCH